VESALEASIVLLVKTVSTASTAIREEYAVFAPRRVLKKKRKSRLGKNHNGKKPQSLKRKPRAKRIRAANNLWIF
jgi:hypothetical protein